MGGINIYQKQTFRTLYNDVSNEYGGASPVVAPTTVPGGFAIFTNGDSFQLHDPIFTQAQAANDEKVYLRQCKKDIYYKNEGPAPLFLKFTWFRVRKNIPNSLFSSFSQLLNAGIPTYDLNVWGVPLTLGSTAARYLKWTKTKIRRLNPGSIGRFKLNLKYKNPRLVTLDVDGSESYLSTAKTIGCIVQVIPSVRTGFNALATGTTAPTATVMVAPAAYCVSFYTLSYVSLLATGDNDPSYSLPVVDSLNPNNLAAYYGHTNVPNFAHVIYPTLNN